MASFLCDKSFTIVTSVHHSYKGVDNTLLCDHMTPFVKHLLVNFD